MSWAPKFGESLLIPSGPQQGQMHLHVVLNDPRDLPGFGPLACALACICSVPTSGIPYDNMRILAADTHPFIGHDSYVSYRHFQVMPAARILQSVATGVYVLHTPFVPEYVSHMISGYHASRRIPGYLKGLPI